MDRPTCVLCFAEFKKRKIGHGYGRETLRRKMHNTDCTVHSALQNHRGYKGSDDGYICPSCYLSLMRTVRASQCGGLKRKKALPPSDTAPKAKRPSRSPSMPSALADFATQWYTTPTGPPSRKKPRTNRIPKERLEPGCTTAITNAVNKGNYYTAFKHILARGRAAKKAFDTLAARLVKTELRRFTKAQNCYPVLNNMDSIEEFSWPDLVNKFNDGTPTLSSVIHAAMPEEKNEHIRSTIVPRIGFMMTIPLYTINPQKFRYVQALCSKKIWKSGGSEELFRCLNQLGVCQGHSATKRQADKFCKQSESEICQWKLDVENDAEAPKMDPEHNEETCTASTSSMPDPQMDEEGCSNVSREGEEEDEEEDAIPDPDD